MPKEFPSFIIDRSRRSKQANQSDDFIVCTDSEVGFVARVCKLNRTQFTAHEIRVSEMSPANTECRYLYQKFGSVAVLIEVVALLHPPLVDRPRLKSLMKKGLKAYLDGEAKEVAATGSSIDKQIATVKEVERLATSQIDSLVDNNGRDAALEIIRHLGDAVTSLEILRKMTEQFSSSES